MGQVVVRQLDDEARDLLFAEPLFVAELILAEALAEALADRDSAPLVTADARLAAKVAGTHWSDPVLPLRPAASNAVWS